MSTHRMARTSNARVGLGLLALACSPGGASAFEPEDSAGSAQNAGGAPSGGASESATAGSPDGLGLLGIDAGAAGSTGFDGPDGACAATSLAAENVVVTKTVEVPYEVTETQPVALYIMLDQSGSMTWPPFPPTKWDMALAGITSFVNDPQSAGLDVALQLFPGAGQCDGSGYDVPSVPLGPLPANAAAITSGLPAQPAGSGGTPIEGGLRGAERFCQAFQQQKPNERCAVVFVTDGQPTNCDTNPANIVNVAAQALQQDGVLTFAIGMAGADFNMMNAIATAGGTDCTPTDPASAACNISGGTDFFAALATIRSSVTVTKTRTETRTETQSTQLDCTWQVPTAPAGQTFDPAQVNVRFAADGVPAESLGGVPSEADCGQFTNGWYYDDRTSPTNINACPDTCAMVQAATNAHIDVLLGCKTEPAIPR